MEIERKYLIPELPADLDSYPSDHIWQAYLCASPTLRIRRKGDRFYLTYKGKGQMAREEYNLPLSEKGFAHLAEKIDGIPIIKTRYRIPVGPYTAELDLFHGAHEGLCLVEVEFPSVTAADAFVPPSWFGPDVSSDPRFRNTHLAFNANPCNSAS